MSTAPLQLETVPCPLCGGRAFEPLARHDRYDMGLITAGCTGCGLLMTNPRPTQGALELFYRHSYRRYYQQTARPDSAYIRRFRKAERAAATAAYIARSLGEARLHTVLDIGCAEGSTLRALSTIDPGMRRYGVEPGEAFAAFARQHAMAQVFPELAAAIAELRRHGESIDLVVLIHVLEHVTDPVAFLRDLAPLLSAKGRVYVDVPDAGAYRDLGSLHIAHLYHFNEACLRLLVAKAGFAIDSLEHYQPIRHPASMRLLIRAAAEPPAPADIAATLRAAAPDWQRIRAIDRSVWRYRLWHWPERIRRRLKTLGGGSDA